MSAATQNEMERLMAERDSAVDQVAYWRERAVAGEAERDALAAHVERLNANAECCADELAALIDRHNTQNMEDGSWEYDHQTPHELMITVRDKPTTSLARLKAQWQADAVETAVARGYRSRDELAGWAEHLRRQAEEPTNGHH